jgi:hypothetical protein
MSYFTIRGVIDLATSVLEEKQVLFVFIFSMSSLFLLRFTFLLISYFRFILFSDYFRFVSPRVLFRTNYIINNHEEPHEKSKTRFRGADALLDTASPDHSATYVFYRTRSSEAVPVHQFFGLAEVKSKEDDITHPPAALGQHS